MIYLDNIIKIIHNINIFFIFNIERFYFKLNNYRLLYYFLNLKIIYINHIMELYKISLFYDFIL